MPPTLLPLAIGLARKTTSRLAVYRPPISVRRGGVLTPFAILIGLVPLVVLLITCVLALTPVSLSDHIEP